MPRLRLSQRNGVHWVSVRAWLEESRHDGVAAMAQAKDELDEEWLAAMVLDLQAAALAVLGACDGVVSAPGPRHSAFIGVPHFATLAAERLADVLGLEHRPLFAPSAARHKGHHPMREKARPSLVGDAPKRALLIDDVATTGQTLEWHVRALQEAGARVSALGWIYGTVKGV